MKPVEQIKLPIAKEMELFETKFKDSMLSKVPLLNRITYYIVRRKGKQMRPMFVFLVAKMVSNGGFDERTYRGASVVELIHTATLVHDDVVDDSNRRRGFFSINALWKNKIAVLVGDYLLSKGLLLSIDNEDFDLLKLISIAVREMSEGELLQIEKARKLDITEEVYFEIIRQKTATLIAACCGIGAASVGANNKTVQQMRKFGEYIGIAFQIKDDLFDYTEDKIGKPTGIDIKEQKMTLPLIYTLNTCSPKEKSWLINSVKKHNKNKKRVKEVIAFVKENGGLEYTTAKMHDYKNKALAILDNYPDSDYKNSLLQMIDYVVERKI
ncbi:MULTISPECIES: polyprenyl synthetase family protein [Tenacibaculum]|uniref:Polyprenyl synthetase family protein n=3 Tax=Bacteria TaxID=2 RepID=A0AAE9SHW4_9FLAO|nr:MULTISPECIES: polyprenyl synthetase family protein [Tenacibaculum]AZJ33601.1 polyprenyl synthetase family protein [Tenacibaculum mesophilum]KAF9659812.1 polyprenyl synthetase family protein [Tenacibaculum mesophilum]MCG7501930.1 polyprenyl synthetase family protein [Tenacibaculum sp. Mcav3-52]QFS28843.1 polyprenyl synthetase family protein [Tenacibaculum mesophilum]UTD16259.1 polyprenyl synthetase family protein [Tenacibaculum mesophilum]|eukprot:TRINITY_DN1157_c0_g1_i1.p5 TRINITY_DN1157_c0_g1~~TRINITY_DN1157_c0_g1_i1.p5  ORF type:complete len:326 (-),score=69.66 TRINITY_DN1157_c0_g1_i1:105-1082(-)